MTHRLVSLVSFVFLAFLGCGREAAPPMEGPAAPHGQERARVVTVTMEAEVDHRNLRALGEELRRVAEAEGGYVEHSSVDPDRAEIAFRVPADRLGAFKRGVHRHVDRTPNERQTVEDVGDRIADLDARLRSARTSEERMLRLMSDRTGSLADVIAIEERMATVRDRIETLEGERATIAQRVDYATVTVIVTHTPVAFWEQPMETMAAAGAFGVAMACAITVGFAATVAALFPTIAVFGLALAAMFYATRFVVRRRRTWFA